MVYGFEITHARYFFLSQTAGTPPRSSHEDRWAGCYEWDITLE